MASTRGLSGRANIRRAPADKQSKNLRRDSANNVSYANVLLPEPLGPISAINLPVGNVRLICLSVFCEAPVMRISIHATGTTYTTSVLTRGGLMRRVGDKIFHPVTVMYGTRLDHQHGGIALTAQLSTTV